jgi:hypothetical protein
MRRRNMYAQPVAEPSPLLCDNTPVPRGTCPKCHEYIGRGIAGHMRRCSGEYVRSDESAGKRGA